MSQSCALNTTAILLTSYSKWRAWTATLCTIAVAAGFAVTEAVLILTLRV